MEEDENGDNPEYNHARANTATNIPALSIQNIKLNELLMSLQSVQQRGPVSDLKGSALLMGSQLSAISPFKRNHLIGHSGDNISGASSVTSWTDKSFNPYSPACNSY